MANIGGGGAGPSKQPVGGGDTSHGSFSSNVDDDPLFTDADPDVLITTANIPELHGSYDRDPTLDPGYKSAVSYIKALVPDAGTSGTSQFQSPNVQGAKEYAGTSAENVFQSPELGEDFFDGINDMPYFNSAGVGDQGTGFSDSAFQPLAIRTNSTEGFDVFAALENMPTSSSNSTGVGEQVSGILETVPDTVHSFTQQAYSSSPNPVHPWYAIRTVPLGTTRPELASKELDGLQYRFINKRDFTSTFQKVFPHANISYMVSALPKYDPSRYADFGVPFAHLTGLFPMPCAYCPEIITPPVWKDVNHRAAAAFVATVAAEFAVVIRGWSRIYMSHNGLSLEQCTVLSRRALAMLYPKDPILGPDGLVSFHTAFAPYFRHLKSQVDIDRVPIPLPRGRLARFSFTQTQDPYARDARDSTQVGPVEIRDRHVRGSSVSSVLASTSQSRDRNVRGRVQPSTSQFSVRGRAKASTSLSSSSSHEASFLCLPHPSPKFVCPRYERISVPVEHLNAMFPHQLPYLPRGDPRSSAVFMELDHHRAASTFCAAAAADMCMIVDKWARMFGLPQGLPMEESYLLAREALGLLLPRHPAFGRQGLTTFHTGLVPYYRCLHELQKRVPTPELFGDPGNPYYYNTLPDIYDASLPR